MGPLSPHDRSPRDRSQHDRPAQAAGERAGPGAPAARGRVLIAPDKFKGTLTAREVAAHVAAGLRAAGVAAGDLVPVPVADGGDGTVDAAVAAGYRLVELTVRGPAGLPVVASFALLEETAVIEAAQACGLSLLRGAGDGELAPLTATSWGVGELIAAAAGQGAKTIVLGLGGSATTDGGAGLVQALGGRLTDADGIELPPGGGPLATLAAVDTSGLRDLAGAEVLLASDVDNPLLGPAGAAPVYGPQKGASAADVPVLAAALARWADVAEAAVGQAARDQPGAGAAGGLGFAAQLFLGARMRPGIDLLLEMVGFEDRLDGARLVITGEGSLDAQSLHGKAPVGVARAAAAREPAIPVVTVSGLCQLTPEQIRAAGFAAAYALTDVEPNAAACRANPGPLLEQLAARIAADWLR
ncbi:MAG TPA: glycerate kinase [Trebonia sp.]|jgi:glycerate kinase|nr:glycerate kinase [Trebonia sp.]